MPNNTKECPFCGEEILNTAKKCKHCGEWLQTPTNRPGTSSGDRGSVDARAVTKGLKEKEGQDALLSCGSIMALLAAIFIGFWTKTWWIGVIVLVILIAIMGYFYSKE